MANRNSLILVFLCSTTLLSSCGARRVVLPSGSGTPVVGDSTAFAAPLEACKGIRALQAELSLSGRAAGQRMRGRVLAGFLQGALRLEGVAPFGSPVFILVADGQSGTLLLPRDRRVLQGAPPEEILNAMVGVRLGADDLRAALSGCVKAAVDPVAARTFGADWAAVDLSSGGTIYLQRQNGTWRIVAGRYEGLEIDYPVFQGDRPAQVVIRGAALNLVLGLDQVEVNGELPRDQLIAVTLAPGLSPITLDELRRSGPLGQD